MKEVMTRAGITGYSGGSVRMAAASAAVDNGVPIDEVLRTGRWSSWLVFNQFYNRAKLRAVVPLVGRISFSLTSLSSLSVVCRFRSLSEVE